jgi:guanylate kinase
MSNVLVTVTGPSLTGKSVLASQLKTEGFDELVSTTTRPSRANEIDGINYHFITVPQFEVLLNQNAMIECVKVGGNYYGLSKKSFDDVIAKGKNGVVVVEPNGASQVRDFCEKNGILLHQIFVNNSREVLLQRFLERFKEDSNADIKTYSRRLQDMLDIEPKTWVEPALNGTQKYDQIFQDFGLNNQAQVISEIKNAVEKKIAQSHCPTYRRPKL